jgi:tetratricopeptide (TPR) repeat protein
MIARYGQGHWHSHHYCWGLVKLMRANKAGLSQAERKNLRTQAIGEFDYMIKNVPKDFELLADIWTRRGIALGLIGKPDEALKSYDSALTSNTQFTAAHVEKIHILHTMSNNEALKIAIAQAEKAGVDRERLMAAGIKFR